MQYRRFPLIDDVQVSAPGLGCMRLPVLGGADSCAGCGECLIKCPRGIAIPDRLADAYAYLTAD